MNIRIGDDFLSKCGDYKIFIVGIKSQHWLADYTHISSGRVFDNQTLTVDGKWCANYNSTIGHEPLDAAKKLKSFADYYSLED